MTDVLDINTACAIADIVRAAQGNQPVARLIEGGDVIGGTARAICAREGGGFLNSDEDVRDGFLWVTLDSGFEAWWPMRDVIAEVKLTTLALNYKL